MIDGSFVQEIAELEKKSVRTMEIDGLTFSNKDMSPVLYIPRPAPIGLNSLDGLADYLERNVDGLSEKDLIIHVENPESVVLFGKINEKDRKRDRYVDVKIDPAFKKFPFGEYMDQEAFLIRLRSIFQETPDLNEVIKYASKLTSNETIDLGDDGVTQNVAVKKGASGALTEVVQTHGMVTLKPFRTFREIDQPESSFLFRLQLQGDRANIPKLALFEADGGIWRVEAVERISQYLKDKIPGIAIIR